MKLADVRSWNRAIIFLACREYTDPIATLFVVFLNGLDAILYRQMRPFMLRAIFVVLLIGAFHAEIIGVLDSNSSVALVSSVIDLIGREFALAVIAEQALPDHAGDVLYEPGIEVLAEYRPILLGADDKLDLVIGFGQLPETLEGSEILDPLDSFFASVSRDDWLLGLELPVLEQKNIPFPDAAIVSAALKNN